MWLWCGSKKLSLFLSLIICIDSFAITLICLHCAMLARICDIYRCYYQFTLIDFPSESEMTAFFVFFENNIEDLAKELRANGMKKFYVTRVFNKEGKFTVGNWLVHKEAESYKAYDGIWAKFMTEKASKSGLVGKVAPHRCVVQYDYS